ncbi:MAG TPA: zf-HC2 domain-containing protein [Thermoanaerobaculia bacterium]|nr:zf-HC2 domain-containing protein [Thermoanaerobaculia bacterium]
MNCVEARFLIYAYFDREMARTEEGALDSHLAACGSCALRARSAHELARVLRSGLRLHKAQAPERLRLRVYNGTHFASPSRAAVLGLAAAVVLLIAPLVADGVSARRGGSAADLQRLQPALAPQASLVSRKMTGTIVCLHCESLRERGLQGTPGPAHEPAFCTQEGEVWRLLDSPSGFSQASMGQTMTVEGVAFPQSGFLRASRAGY